MKIRTVALIVFICSAACFLVGKFYPWKQDISKDHVVGSDLTDNATNSAVFNYRNTVEDLVVGVEWPEFPEGSQIVARFPDEESRIIALEDEAKERLVMLWAQVDLDLYCSEKFWADALIDSERVEITIHRENTSKTWDISLPFDLFPLPRLLEISPLKELNEEVENPFKGVEKEEAERFLDSQASLLAILNTIRVLAVQK